jgi:hypothetical protein
MTIMLGLAACAGARPVPPQPDLLSARAVNTPAFAGVQVCNRCHLANATVMRDPQGRDVSPIGEWQVSMMGLAARDPYFLAALAREHAARPQQAAFIDDLCLRCHAPVGHAAALAAGTPLRMQDVLASMAPPAELAREGVTCVGCHAAMPTGLGEPSSFNGKLTLRTDRVVFGLLQAPMLDAMRQMIQMSAEPGEHMGQSKLCGSCHTVEVPGLSGDTVLEQATYLEWRASGFSTERAKREPYAAECQQCHMPTVDDDGQPLAVAMSTRPLTAPVRTPYARHTLVGGSAYLLQQLAPFAGWLGAGVRSDELLAAAQRSTALLQQAATLELSWDGERVTVAVTNQTGHKLPTGYPTRRMWLHVQVQDGAGRVVFESGAHRNGKIDGVDDRGEPIVPDVAKLQAGGPPIIWQAVPVGADQRVTHLQLGVARFVKDNRILPRGWQTATADVRLAPIAVAPGSDHATPGRVTVWFATPRDAATVTVELLYQSIAPATIATYDPAANALAARFRTIVAAPPVPSVLTRNTLRLAQ